MLFVGVRIHEINLITHHFLVNIGLAMGTGIIFPRKTENFKKIFCF